MDLEFIDHLKSFLARHGYGLTFIRAKLTGSLYVDQYIEFTVMKCLSKEDIKRIQEKEKN